MPDNYDRRRGYKSYPQSKPNQGGQSAQKKPAESPKRSGDRGPYFLPKILGQEVVIHLVTGQEVRGKLKGFNSYELLIEPADPREPGELSLVFRSAVATVNYKMELPEASKS